MPQHPAEKALKPIAVGAAANFGLAIIKGIAGYIGSSYALMADAVESATDVVSSIIMWSAQKIAAKPPDRDHPYGHGKAEPLAGVFIGGVLFVAAGTLTWKSIEQILSPSSAPQRFTLLVLAIVIVVKEFLFRRVFRSSENLESSALKGDAWHHRCDALTSLAAFVGYR